jgi:hypothetical protein
MIKHLFTVFALLAAPVVYGSTVINYDDGSTYTLSENQEIYISTPSSSLFKRQLMKNKDTFFRVQKPWTKRDYVEQPQDPFVVGSHQWCKTYVPWSEGLTFDMITWQRFCDTDNDGKYGCGDSQFDNSEDAGVCN